MLLFRRGDGGCHKHYISDWQLFLKRVSESLFLRMGNNKSGRKGRNTTASSQHFYGQDCIKATWIHLAPRKNMHANIFLNRMPEECC